MMREEECAPHLDYLLKPQTKFKQTKEGEGLLRKFKQVKKKHSAKKKEKPVSFPSKCIAVQILPKSSYYIDIKGFQG